MVRKFIVVLLAFMLTLSLCGTALAAEEPSDNADPDGTITPCYTYISYTSCGLNINSAGRANCAASISAYSGVDKVRISGYLQYYSGGWQTVKNWTAEASGTYVSMAKTYYVSQGYQYRWLCYYYAYKGSSTESTSDAVYWNYY